MKYIILIYLFILTSCSVRIGSGLPGCMGIGLEDLKSEPHSCPKPGHGPCYLCD